MTEPTDAELIALLGDRQFSTIGAVREALRRWGTPPAVKMEPALHQYQARDGTWKDFDSERHRRDTVAAGYPVRTLYTVTQPQAGAVPQCWCLTCRPMRLDDPYSIRMALCPTCGNKRCPKANDHRNACTGSNELGQPGSAYFGGIKGSQHER